MIYCCGLIQQNRLYQKHGPIRKYGPLTKRAVHIYKNQVLLKDIQIQRSLETKVYIYIPSSSLTLWKTPPFKHIVS